VDRRVDSDAGANASHRSFATVVVISTAYGGEISHHSKRRVGRTTRRNSGARPVAAVSIKRLRPRMIPAR